MRNFLIFFSIFFSLYLSACLNEIHVNKEGKTFVSQEQHPVPKRIYSNNQHSEYLKKLEEYDTRWNSEHNINDYINYGVYLVYLNHLDEALEVFTEAEKIEPGLYATAANMGTTYELLGDNENALQWIEKALKIDSTSHESSEWIHVAILKAKIKGETNLTALSLIGQDFGNENIPSSGLNEEKLNKLAKEIFYQLDERINFIKPKDAIVAELMFNLGNIYFLLNDATSALRVYDEARVYGYSSELFERRYRTLMDIHQNLDHTQFIEEGNDLSHMLTKHRNDLIRIAIIITGIITLTIFCIVLYFNKKKRKKR
ncbi:tetratricopeptide repeat protein [Apibacter sp. HY039]|uniref:tetratricopeptide repeat protein n=1 Tax=Apibacter sp. HY039 TaxID=2501476 RepID=UPI000FEB91DF|nr:hypothetical protein [Apibacter sp. HY039]